jgi:glycosyltransferase involved in cell wall biosynthesis
VRLDRFDSAHRSPQPGRILSIGRLVPKKGFPVLIQACAFLRQRGVDFHLDLVGDGLIADDLKELVVECGLTGRVTFHGGRPQPELVPFYEQATVFALAPEVQADGDRDGIPNVILEAMASGTPVVAAATSGIPEVVFDNETGLLVPPGDPEALADGLQRLLGDPAEAERLGKGGEVAVRGAFEIATCVTPMTDLLRTRLDAVRAGRS